MGVSEPWVMVFTVGSRKKLTAISSTVTERCSNAADFVVVCHPFCGCRECKLYLSSDTWG